MKDLYSCPDKKSHRHLVTTNDFTLEEAETQPFRAAAKSTSRGETQKLSLPSLREQPLREHSAVYSTDITEENVHFHKEVNSNDNNNIQNNTIPNKRKDSRATSKPTKFS